VDKTTKKKINVIAFLAAFGQILAYVALELNGKIFDDLAQRHAMDKTLAIIAGFFVLQIVSALHGVGQEKLKNWFVLKEFRNSWLSLYPSQVTKEDLPRSESFFQTIYGNFPAIISLRLDIAEMAVGSIVIYVMFLCKVIADRNWLALLFVPLVSVLFNFAGRLFEEKYEASIKETLENKAMLMAWIRNFFEHSRDRQVNWRYASAEKTRTPYERVGDHIESGLKQRYRIALWRSFGKLGLANFPHICIVTSIMLMGLYGKMSIASIIVWLGLIDLLIQATGNLIAIRSDIIELRSTAAVIDKDVSWLKRAAPHQADQASTGAEISETFRLLDNSLVTLGLQPGLFHISGRNGSGKSSLIDVLLGFQTSFDHWEPERIQGFRAALSTGARVVESSPVVLNDYRRFEQQVYGESFDGTQSFERMLSESFSILSLELRTLWISRILDLRDLWDKRNVKDLSKGEKVVLGIARAFSHWNSEVAVLICDEVEAGLDQSSRELFLRLISELRQKIAVYLVSHVLEAPDEPNPEPPAAWSLWTQVFLLGYSEEQNRGIVLPVEISMTAGGSGNINTAGVVADSLVHEVKAVRQALINCNEIYVALHDYDLFVDCRETGVHIGDSRSAGLAIATALMSLMRMTQGIEIEPNIAATGRVHLDGTIAPVHFLEEKIAASRAWTSIKTILTPSQFEHLSELEAWVIQNGAVAVPTPTSETVQRIHS
jgi:energy-coupling factor transporter ATP-binding protein EcfA2